jgi:hypothetical protein
MNNMAHFAEIDNNGTVIRVLVVGDDQEHRGQDFLANDLGLGGTWVQTSYNHKIRKQFAGVGFKYDADADVFIAPKPYDSWTLDDNHDWQAPVAKPEDENIYNWNEKNQEWEIVNVAE